MVDSYFINQEYVGYTTSINSKGPSSNRNQLQILIIKLTNNCKLLILIKHAIQ